MTIIATYRETNGNQTPATPKPNASPTPPSVIVDFVSKNSTPTYDVYLAWCAQNSLQPVDQKSFDAIFYPEPAAVDQTAAFVKNQLAIRQRQHENYLRKHGTGRLTGRQRTR